MRTLAFILRHAVASAVVIGGSVAFICAAYFAMVFVGVVFYGDPGGPLVLPAAVLLALVGSGVAASIAFVLTSLSGALCSRVRRLRRLTEILVVHALFLAGLTLFIAMSDVLRPDVALVLGGIAFALVGVYWWTATFVAFACDVCSRAMLRL